MRKEENSFIHFLGGATHVNILSFPFFHIILPKYFILLFDKIHLTTKRQERKGAPKFTFTFFAPCPLTFYNTPL